MWQWNPWTYSYVWVPAWTPGAVYPTPWGPVVWHP